MMIGLGTAQIPHCALELLPWLSSTLAPAILAWATQAPLPRRLRSRREEWAALKKIVNLAAGSTDPRAIAEAIADEALRECAMDAAALQLRSGADTPLSVFRGFGTELVEALEAWQVEPGALPPEDRMFSIEDLPRFGGGGLQAALSAEGFRVFAFRPLVLDGRTAGTFALANRRPVRIGRSRAAFQAALLEILGISWTGAGLREQAHKLSDDLIAVHEVNKIISQSLDHQDIIRRIVIEGRRLVKTRHCHLFLLDDRQNRLVGSASTLEAGINIREVTIGLAEDSNAVRALIEKRVIHADDMSALEPAGASGMKGLQWRAAIYAPLIAKDQAVGVLICSNETAGNAFTREEISRAETLAHQAAIALENARLFQVVSRSQKEWETTFDAMQDCVSVHDTSGKIIRANVALARRLKTTPPKMIGKCCGEIYNPDQLNFGPCRHMELLQSENLLVEEIELGVMGGTFQVSVSPWYDKNNRLAGSIHVAKDVSNETLLRQQLIQSEKLSAIGELISGIAHELNNPLTGVMGYSQLLQLRKDLDDRARDSLLKINNLALRCQKIVQNLLSFARKQKPERTLSNVNEILERTVELRNYEFSVNNIQIVRELDRNLPRTIADSHQLQQVFLNIITNAEHAMLQACGRGRLTIRSRADLPNSRIVVEISDDGPGIPEAHLSKIFDPFFTTKEVGKGTGLGLSLAYGIIKEHGGNIYALSRQGEGATFVVELPIISKLPDTKLFPDPMPQALEFENIVRNKKALIVDDEKYILDFFVEILRMFPIQVDTACDGRVAMEKLSRTDYDIIITDFKMPQMNGRELYEWIKENRHHLAMRIIFITGDTISGETRLFFEHTCNLYLAKPFKIEEVKEVIQQTLENASH